MVLDAPEPGSHDRSMPSGVLEESSMAIFEAMLAARDAEALRSWRAVLVVAALLLGLTEAGALARRYL